MMQLFPNPLRPLLLRITLESLHVDISFIQRIRTNLKGEMQCVSSLWYQPFSVTKLFIVNFNPKKRVTKKNYQTFLGIYYPGVFFIVIVQEQCCRYFGPLSVLMDYTEIMQYPCTVL